MAAAKTISTSHKDVKEKRLPIEKLDKSGSDSDVSSLKLVAYKKCIAVIGSTREYKAKLKELGGKWNAGLACGQGWIFSVKMLKAVKKFVLSKDGSVEDDIEKSVNNAKESGSKEKGSIDRKSDVKLDVRLYCVQQYMFDNKTPKDSTIKVVHVSNSEDSALELASILATDLYKLQSGQNAKYIIHDNEEGTIKVAMNKDVHFGGAADHQYWIFKVSSVKNK